MKLALIISTLLLCSSALAGQKLIGGAFAKNALYPSTVQLSTVKNQRRVQNCTGALISKTKILSAAHCFYNDFTKRVRGDFRQGKELSISNRLFNRDEQKHWKVSRIKKVHLHPSYEAAHQKSLKKFGYHEFASYFGLDVAVIELEDEVHDIPLAELDFEETIIDDQVSIGGYGCEYKVQGSTSFPKGYPFGRLKRRSTKVVGSKKAFRKARHYSSYKKTIQKHNFFTLGKAHSDEEASLCPGDSGGPVYKDGKVVGINAFYGFRRDNVGISSSNWHARVQLLKDWDILQDL